MAKHSFDEQSNPAEGPDQVPLEVLEHRLTSRAADLAAAEAEWMLWLAEYDRRQGWAEWGCHSPAHWLSWKCGLSPSAARERVRVANALVGLPEIREAFAAGRLTYSKVQAVTRIANEYNESDLAYMAIHATGAQLARIVAGYRASAEDPDQAAFDAYTARSYSERINGDGTSTIKIRVPDDVARVIRSHVETVTTAIIDDAVDGQRDHRREAIAERHGIAAVRADAAAALLTGEATDIEPTPADLTLVVDDNNTAQNTAHNAAHNDAADANTPTDRHTGALPSADDTCAQALAVYQDEVHAVPEPIARALTCDARIRALVESADRGPLAVGRSTRIINRRMRRALNRRDRGHCQFPGCQATRRLHAHHIIHWADGGRTDIDNLILLCQFHHRLIHVDGWNIDPATRQFSGPKGDPVASGPRLRAGADGRAPHPPVDDAFSHLSPLEPPFPGPLDLAWTTTLLHHNESQRRAGVW